MLQLRVPCFPRTRDTRGTGGRNACAVQRALLARPTLSCVHVCSSLLARATAACIAAGLYDARSTYSTIRSPFVHGHGNGIRDGTWNPGHWGRDPLLLFTTCMGRIKHTQGTQLIDPARGASGKRRSTCLAAVASIRFCHPEATAAWRRLQRRHAIPSRQSRTTPVYDISSAVRAALLAA